MMMLITEAHDYKAFDKLSNHQSPNIIILFCTTAVEKSIYNRRWYKFTETPIILLTRVGRQDQSNGNLRQSGPFEMAPTPMFCVAVAVQFIALVSTATALWPQPRVFKHGNSTVWISPTIQLSVLNRTSSLWPLAEVGRGVQHLL